MHTIDLIKCSIVVALVHGCWYSVEIEYLLSY